MPAEAVDAVATAQPSGAATDPATDAAACALRAAASLLGSCTTSGRWAALDQLGLVAEVASYRASMKQLGALLPSGLGELQEASAGAVKAGDPDRPSGSGQRGNGHDGTPLPDNQASAASAVMQVDGVNSHSTIAYNDTSFIAAQQHLTICIKLCTRSTQLVMHMQI